jgi:predicted XRE-type DNA-binding protein
MPKSPKKELQDELAGSRFGAAPLPGTKTGTARMKTRKFSTVWDAIEDTAEDSENMRLRSELMIALKERISRRAMTQAQAAKLFGVTQPRVSDLLRGKVNLFGLDALVKMATAAGLHVELRIRGAA